MRRQLAGWMRTAASMLALAAVAGWLWSAGTWPSLPLQGVRADSVTPGIDQRPLGDPECTAENFPNHGGGNVQELRPRAIGLAAVQLCIEGGADARIVVFVRTGTAFSPGLILGGADVTLEQPTFGYVQVPFDHILYTPPGDYVIEVHADPGARWRAGPMQTDSIRMADRTGRTDWTSGSERCGVCRRDFHSAWPTSTCSATHPAMPASSQTACRW